jgi:pyruvate dehydrogenase E2 component (dihydrolipoamide acetyltransferase)
MGQIQEVAVPDIGDFKDVPIIEIAVKVGERIKAEAPLITLESDKASMEVPSPSPGIVKSIAVKLGDKVSQGTPILSLELDGPSPSAEQAKPAVTPPPAPTSAPSGVAEVRVPDIGDFKDVPIIEVSVKPGDTVKAEQPLITLESDKASMEVPSPFSGTVAELKVKKGDRVSEGTVILTLMTEGEDKACWSKHRDRGRFRPQRRRSFPQVDRRAHLRSSQASPKRHSMSRMPDPPCANLRVREG